MADTISTKQNSYKQLNCLAAQRSLYKIAKRFTGLRIFLSVPLMVAVSVFVLVLNRHISFQKIQIQQTDISWIAASVGVTVTLIDLMILSPLVDKYKNKAAKMQELFDTSVFEMPWNKVVSGCQPDHEEISKYSRQIRKNQAELNKIEDWYTDKLDNIPLTISTIICQRSNICWDKELREIFSNIMALAALFLFLLLLIIGFCIGLSLKNFFLVVLAPCLPIIVYTIRLREENIKAISQLINLKELINRTWSQLLSKNINHNQLLINQRSIQDQIYLNRKSNPLIFDWLYNLKKSMQHEDMFYSIDSMIEEYQQSNIVSTDFEPVNNSV